jgi:predicted transcriptional regulator
MNERPDGALPVRPRLKLVGTDGNVFAVIGRVKAKLVEVGQPDAAKEFVERAFKSRSYDEVLQLCFSYVEPY